MNKALINVLLFFTLVMGTVAILSFDAWADTSTTDVYDIPNDYESRNSYIEFYRDYSVEGSTKHYETYIYDFDVYVPKDYDWVLFCYEHNPYSWHDLYTSLLIYSNDGYGFISFSEPFYVDCNGVTKKTVTINDVDVDVYIKNNGSIFKKVYKSLKKDDVSNNSSVTSYITLSSLYDRSLWYSDSRYDVNFNQSIIYSVYSGFDFRSGYSYYVYHNSELKLIPSDITNNYFSMYRYSSTIDKQEFLNVLAADLKKIRNQQSMTSFPEPVLKSARFNSDINIVQLVYNRDSECVPDLVENYNKVYVKLQNDSEWKTLDNSIQGERIVSVANNNQFKVIAGSLDIDRLNNALGYDETDEESVLPVIEGVIWGMRYGYKTIAGNYKYTNYVFNRYVFADNIVSDTDISIDDLGNLTDIKPGSSGSDVTVKPGGSSNTPTISDDNNSTTNITDWIKNFKFDFSSVTNAIQSSFSLVTDFASMMGTIFQNFFGEAVGIVAILAIGICVVLRLIGR